MSHFLSIMGKKLKHNGLLLLLFLSLFFTKTLMFVQNCFSNAVLSQFVCPCQVPNFSGYVFKNDELATGKTRSIK